MYVYIYIEIVFVNVFTALLTNMYLVSPCDLEYICVYVCMYVRTYVCMYIFMHTYIHTCTPFRPRARQQSNKHLYPKCNQDSHVGLRV